MSRLELVLRRSLKPTGPRPTRTKERLSINLVTLFHSITGRRDSPQEEKAS